MQFKGHQIERKFPVISAWTVDMVQKRFADEKRSGASGREKVLDRVRKPVVDVENNETIQGKEKESDGVEVQVLVGDKAAMSDVEKISTKMKILAAAIVKFGKAMAEVGSKNMGKDIIKKTFSKMSDMLNVASTSQPAETSTLLDDDPIFNDEGFLAAVSAMEKAFIVTTNPVEHPKEVELDGLPSSPRFFFAVLRHDHYFIICLNFKKRVVQVIDNKTLGKGSNFVSRYENCDKILDLFLTSLRAKYAVDIIFSEMNEYIALENICIGS
nr:uncharacterized protein LOC109172327 [Ipomoea batatas]